MEQAGPPDAQNAQPLAPSRLGVPRLQNEGLPGIVVETPRASLAPAALSKEQLTGTPARPGHGAATSHLDLPPSALGPLVLRQAAAEGNPEAQFRIAERYMRGERVAKNYAEAAKWFARAAAKGYPPAQFRLATLHERGLGVPRDRTRARVWYRRAAEQGNVRAMHNLAVLLARKRRGNPDYAAAAKWFERAAERGLKDSQFNLAILYQSGLGVSRSAVHAYKWFALAAAQGDKEAAKRLVALRTRLSPTEVALGDRLVALWQPKPRDPRANLAVSASESAGRQARSQAPSGQGRSVALKRARVLEAQRLLAKLGYRVGVPDGRLGPQTQRAIRQFELSVGLKSNGGRVTQPLLERLRNLAS